MRVKNPVVAIGLDAADPVLLERYLDAGHLPVLARLRDEGTYARLTTFDYCRAEASNTTFLTGCSPAKHGYWSPFRFKTDYRCETTPYEFADYQPFYGLGTDYRVAVFDMPQSKLSKHVNGIQVLGWGAHSPRCPSHSEPPELFSEIVDSHGEHPTLRKDDVHSMGDEAALLRLKHGLEIGVERRAAACVDLLTRERWDLFLTYFSEIHSGQHYLWHLSHPDHPLYSISARLAKTRCWNSCRPWIARLAASSRRCRAGRGSSCSRTTGWSRTRLTSRALCSSPSCCTGLRTRGSTASQRERLARHSSREFIPNRFSIP